MWKWHGKKWKNGAFLKSKRQSNCGLISLPRSLVTTSLHSCKLTPHLFVCEGGGYQGWYRELTQPLFPPRNWTPEKNESSHICIFIIEPKPGDQGKRILGVGRQFSVDILSFALDCLFKVVHLAISLGRWIPSGQTADLFAVQNDRGCLSPEQRVDRFTCRVFKKIRFSKA